MSYCPTKPPLLVLNSYFYQDRHISSACKNKIVMRKTAFLLSVIILLLPACQNQQKDAAPLRPNIVYILADDLGYGDLSSYGQQLFSTPHIDKLAENGLKFTQHYSGSTVCAPSRSSLLTGQHTGHTFIRGNKKSPTRKKPPRNCTISPTTREKQTTGPGNIRKSWTS